MLAEQPDQHAYRHDEVQRGVVVVHPDDQPGHRVDRVVDVVLDGDAEGLLQPPDQIRVVHRGGLLLRYRVAHQRVHPVTEADENDLEPQPGLAGAADPGDEGVTFLRTAVLPRRPIGADGTGGTRRDGRTAFQDLRRFPHRATVCQTPPARWSSPGRVLDTRNPPYGRLAPPRSASDRPCAVMASKVVTGNFRAMPQGFVHDVNKAPPSGCPPRRPDRDDHARYRQTSERCPRSGSRTSQSAHQIAVSGGIVTPSSSAVPGSRRPAASVRTTPAGPATRRGSPCTRTTRESASRRNASTPSGASSQVTDSPAPSAGCSRRTASAAR